MVSEVRQDLRHLRGRGEVPCVFPPAHDDDRLDAGRDGIGVLAPSLVVPIGDTRRMPTPIVTIPDLIRAIEEAGGVEYLFFWSHQPEPDGSIGAGCLSQWWPAPFILDGARFATAEHYMMWRKARLFKDLATAEKILATTDPHQAKALGRQIRGYDEQTWRKSRFDVVETGSVAKFGQNDDLRSYLLNTGERVLVEASPHDRIWGIGLSAEDERARFPHQWRGLNLLGFALMKARERLREDT
jgi:hypothetical protein